MAARSENTKNGRAKIVNVTVAALKTTTAGFPVKRSGADKYVEAMAAVGDDVYGIALDTCVAADICRVALFGRGIVPCLVGTSGATEGATAVMDVAVDGLTDGTVGGGTTKQTKCGTFMQTGVAGDLVGLNIASNTGPDVTT